MLDARLLAVALCWLLASAAVGPSLGTGGPSFAAGTSPAPEQPAVDDTVTRIEVRASGDATWAVVVRTHLETDEEVEQYRAFQEGFRNDTSRYLDPFRGRIRSVVDDARSVTGREMRVTNFSATTHVEAVPRRWGVVTYRFRWTNFAARPSEDALAIGDVFQGGYYLDQDDIFAVGVPDGYALDTASPAPDQSSSRVVRWFGPRDFGDQRPRAVFRANESDETTPSTDAPGATTEPASSGGVPETLFVGVVAVAFGVGAAAVWRIRSRRTKVRPSDDGSESPPAAPARSDPAPVKTDAERVEALLRERGGRTKQAEIADALDWSASKTSRVLSDLEDDGAIERIRLGRENVVDLSDAGDE